MLIHNPDENTSLYQIKALPQQAETSTPRLGLYPSDEHPEFKKPIFINFYQYPRFHAKLRKVLKISAGSTIIDATAGFCRDAVIMANMGAQVLALERSPMIWALIQNAALHSPLPNLDLKFADALTFLTELPTTKRPDAIYLDPMFPESLSSHKTALVKKEMRILRDIVGPDLDSKDLLNIAQKKALDRVVVKRSQTDPYLGNTEPHFSAVGLRNRYDIYLTFNKEN